MNSNELAGHVRDFFLQQYNALNRSDSFIAFEPLGNVIDTELAGQTAGVLAGEQLSILADDIPEISDVYVNGLSSLSSVYSSLVHASTFWAGKSETTDKSEYMSLFGKIKNEILGKLEQADRASVNDPGGKYYPCMAFPENWYDAASNVWTHKTFTMSDKKTAPSSSPVGQSAAFVWRNKIDVSQMGKKTKVLTGAVTDLKTAQIFTKFARPVLLPQKELRQVSRTQSVLKRETLQTATKEVGIAGTAAINRTIANTGIVQTRPLNSSGFSLSFDYCLVQLHRYWFDTRIFDSPELWYALTQNEAAYSTGKKNAENHGLLRCVTKAMIVIKDLKITANWSEEDSVSATSSVGLGCFNLTKSQFSNNQLSAPSIQIIGWICEVLPKLPLHSDPNMNG